MKPVRKLVEPWRRPRNVPPLSRAAKLFVAGNSISALGAGLSMPYFAIFLIRSGGGALSAAGVLALISVVDIASQWLLAGPLQRRMGSRLPAIAGCWAQAVGWACLSLCSTQWQVFPSAVAIGLGNALFFAVRTNLQMGLVEEAARPYSFSLRYLAGNVAMVCGSALGGTIVSQFGMRALSVLLVGNAVTFAVYAVILASAVTSDRPKNRSGAAKSQKQSGVRSRRPVGLVVGYFLVVAAGLVQFESVLPLQLTTQAGVAPWLAGYLFSGFTLAAAILQMPVSRLSTRLGGVKSIRALAVAWIAGVAVLAGSGAEPAVRDAAVVLGILALAFGECFFSPAVPGLLQTDDIDLRMRAGVLTSSAHSLGQFVGPSLGVLLVAHSAYGFYALVGVGALVAAVVVRGLPARTSEAPQPPTVAVGTR